jgi:hypothetical protein
VDGYHRYWLNFSYFASYLTAMPLFKQSVLRILVEHKQYGLILNKRLNDAYKLISEETILRMAKRDPAINNVVTALQKECFGIWSNEDVFSPNYTLVYINGDTELQGEAIELSLEDKDRYHLTMAFCNHLTQEYKHLDLLDVFNTYSQSLRTYIEFYGYTTIGDNIMEELDGYNYTLITKSKGVIYVPTIDKLKFYRQFFGDIYNQEKPKNENVVYLLLEMKSGHIKIGRSIKITYREKTLQAQAPTIETIAFWKAPKEVETHLHKTFASKRLRGEWFKLTFTDMKIIQSTMLQYL